MANKKVITFPDGDYSERLNTLWAAFQEAKSDEDKAAADGMPTGRTLGEGFASVTLAEEYEALKAEAGKDAVKKKRRITLVAVGRKVWRELKDKHPARKGDDVDEDTVKADARAGVDVDGIADDLVYASVTEPKFNSRDAFDEWADGLTEGEFQIILTESWRLANGAEFNPKALPASAIRSSAPS